MMKINQSSYKHWFCFFLLFAGLLTASQGYGAGLIAAYSFDSITGTTIADQSGLGHSATASNATWTATGHSGGAVSFNGTNAWVTVTDAPDLSLTTAMTVEAWVNPAALSGWRTVIMKERPGGLAYTLYASDDNAPPALYTNTGAADVSAVGSNLLTLNVWTHLAGTYDGTTVRLYVNGSLISSKPLSGNLVSSTSPLRIGGNSIWGEYFSGLIDDVRIYDRVLSNAEITTDMNSPVSSTNPDTTAPSITSRTPNTGVTGVALGTNVSVIFNEPINPTTINATTFELRNDANALIDSSVTYNTATNTATLTPSTPLAGSATYTVSLKGGNTDPRVKDMAGNALAASATWTFTTTGTISDTTAPSIASRTPNTGATGVALGTNVSVIFNEPINPITINATTFELRNAANDLIASSVTYNTATNTATLTPSTSLVGSATYTVSLKGGNTDPRVKDLAGNALAASAAWTFETAVSPVNNTAGLIASYSFDAISGNTITDQSGLGHSGTASNATWTAIGHSGGAVSFNGTNAWVTVADAPDLSLTTAMTVEAWVHPAALSGWRTVIMKERPGGLAYTLYASDNNAPPAIYANTGATEVSALGSNLLTLNVWTHLAGTYDGTTVRLYVNGSLISSKPLSGNLVSSTSPLRIGGNSIWGEYFSGLIDDVRIYNRALSNSEISTDMTTPVSVPGPDTTGPSITSRTPNTGATGVAQGTNVTVIFSEPINPTTINATTFELRNAADAIIASSVTYNTATNTATLTPSTSLAGSATYTVSLKGGNTDPRVKDLAGNALAASATWAFTTTAGSSGVGEWGPKINFSTVPVAAAVLPNGKLLIWSSWDRYDFASGTGARDKTYTNVYDPNTGQVSEFLVSNTGHDFFCPGTSMLEDGRIHVSGGGPQVTTTSIYNYTNNQWVRDADMSRHRWYNASTTMPTGQVFTLGGVPDDGVGELWSTNSSWRVLSGLPITPLMDDNGVHMDLSEEHPKLFVAPNGKLFAVGPSPRMHWYDTAANSGNGSVVFAGRRSDDIYAQNNVAVMYDVGKILTAGGNPNYDLANSENTPSSTNTYLVDINSTVTTKKVQSMHYPRAYANGVVLPDGKVLVAGGLDNGKNFTDVGAIMGTEIFDPTTETWSVMAPSPTPRTYHSVAILMPDASVFVGGGGLGGNSCNCNHPDGEIYKPPYLFKETRPSILNAPTTLGYSNVFTVNTTADVTRFSLIRLSSVTHTVNTDQRYLPVQATGNGSGNFSLIAPVNANIAPPGYYMLFALNANGIPSVAKIVQITGKTAPLITSPGSQSNPIGAQINLPIIATSPISESLAYSATGLPSGLSINPTTGVISGTLTSAGTSNVVLSVIGQRGGTATSTFTWSVTDPAMPVNVSASGVVTQSSTNTTYVASRAKDSNTNGILSAGSVTMTNSDTNAWWEIDLGRVYDLTTVNIWNRTDCCTNRLSKFYVFVSNVAFTSKTLSTTQTQSGVSNFYTAVTGGRPTAIQVNRSGRFLRVQLSGKNNLSLAEVEIMGRINRAPIISNPGNRTLTLGSSTSFAIFANDPDGDALNFSATGLPTGLSINPTNGLVTGTPTVSGNNSINVSVSDNKGGISTASFSIAVSTLLSLNQIVSTPKPIGTQISFTAIAQGGLNPKFTWQFGDGSPETTASASANASHAYSQPGRYVVTVSVSDDLGANASSQLVQAVHYTSTTNPPASSSQIVYDNLSSGASRVWNVNPDNDTVTAYDGNLNKLREIAVGNLPQSLAIAPDGQIWVVNQGSNTISIINPNTFQVITTVNLPVASQPYGIVFDTIGAHVYVTLEALGLMLQLDPITGGETGRVEIGPNPRHLSVTGDGARILISRFITPKLPGEDTSTVNTVNNSGVHLGGEVIVVSSSPSLQISKTIVLRHSEAADGTSTGRGIPNYLGVPVISPDGLSAWVPSKQDNIKRGMFRDQRQLTFESTVRAISSRISLDTLVENYPSRIDHDNSGIASAASFDNSGSYLFVALEASGEVAVVDPYNHNELMRINVGLAPQGLVYVSETNQDKLFVHNFMDRTVSAYDVTQLIRSGITEISALTTSNAVSVEKLTSQILKGKQLFYDARDTRLARDRYISCASCHHEGGQDGRIWDLSGFGEGLRNTIDLRGRAGMAHGKLHWSGNFDEVQDFEGQIRGLAGGTGLMTDLQFNTGTRSQPLGDPKTGVSNDLDALSAYVTSLNKFVRSPFRNPDQSGTLTTEGQAGKVLFSSKNCTSCHSATILTDSTQDLLHDVGTLKPGSGSRLGTPFTEMQNPGLDTPTLKGLWATAPYLHDGSASTISESISAHTNIPVLAAEEIRLISVYLNQLDNNTN
jgi:large repetitive protein